MADQLGAIAELAGTYGLGAILEFFPWTVVPNLSLALQVVEASGRANTGILVDTLHFARSDSTFEQLDAVPAERLPFVHVADASAEKPTTTERLIFTARAERPPPGEGGIDIPAIVSRMPAGIPVALEVPMDALDARGRAGSGGAPLPRSRGAHPGQRRKRSPRRARMKVAQRQALRRHARSRVGDPGSRCCKPLRRARLPGYSASSSRRPMRGEVSEISNFHSRTSIFLLG